MALGSVHYAKKDVADTSVCGVTHKKVRLTRDPKKITCPQCKRDYMDTVSGRKAAWRRSLQGEQE